MQIFGAGSCSRICLRRANWFWSSSSECWRATRSPVPSDRGQLLKFLVEHVLENQPDRLKDTRSDPRRWGEATRSIRGPIRSCARKRPGSETASSGITATNGVADTVLITLQKGSAVPGFKVAPFQRQLQLPPQPTAALDGRSASEIDLVRPGWHHRRRCCDALYLRGGVRRRRPIRWRCRTGRGGLFARFRRRQRRDPLARRDSHRLCRPGIGSC